MGYAYDQRKLGTAPAPASSSKADAEDRNIPNSMRLAALESVQAVLERGQAVLESGQAVPAWADNGLRADPPEAILRVTACGGAAG